MAADPYRSPSANHPFQMEARRLPRRRTYADPTGDDAVGNVTATEEKEKQR